MIKKILLYPLKKIRRSRWINFFFRISFAASYYNKKYFQILKWGFSSKEDTNFTYPLTERNIQYLAYLISNITSINFNEIEKYIKEVSKDKNLANFIIDRTKNSAFRNVADLRCDFSKRLGWYAFVRATKPKIVVETGVDKGLGSVLLCSALLKNKTEGNDGYYYGTDINPEAGYLFTKSKYEEVGKILYGDSIESLKKLNKKIDLFINDSDHSDEYEYKEYLTIKDKLSKNAVILGDNSHVTDKLLKFSIENNRKFIFFGEEPKNHWYLGGGIGISYK